MPRLGVTHETLGIPAKQEKKLSNEIHVNKDQARAVIEKFLVETSQNVNIPSGTIALIKEMYIKLGQRSGETSTNATRDLVYE